MQDYHLNFGTPESAIKAPRTQKIFEHGLAQKCKPPILIETTNPDSAASISLQSFWSSFSGISSQTQVEESRTLAAVQLSKTTSKVKCLQLYRGYCRPKMMLTAVIRKITGHQTNTISSAKSCRTLTESNLHLIRQALLDSQCAGCSHTSQRKRPNLF